MEREQEISLAIVEKSSELQKLKNRIQNMKQRGIGAPDEQDKEDAKRIETLEWQIKKLKELSGPIMDLPEEVETLYE